MYDITLKKGRPIRYDIWFGGEPAPTVEWTRNGRTLTNDKATSIELYSRNSIYTEKVRRDGERLYKGQHKTSLFVQNTVLSIPKADRERDTGLYTIKLSCEAGTFEASGRVNVLDVPTQPRMLQPTEIR